MATHKKRAYSQYAKDAVILLGKSIQLGRKARHLTASDFADRIGISRITLQKIEKGNLQCEIGIVLEAAALAGIPLFNVDPNQGTFATNLEKIDDKLALLPTRIRHQQEEVDDDF